jgi:acyl-CoA thioester hydrolase
MPLVHTRNFRVRHYECDAYGHLNNANYLRYMQEAAFDASAAVGYDMARYDAMDRFWLIRETEIEYRHPLRYGDSVQVKTWVADFRQIRSRRAYEFTRATTGQQVARASTDWVFLERSTGRPAAIPPEMKAAFLQKGVPESIQPRERFASVAPPSLAFRQRRRVEWRDIDSVGHVNNAVYLSYIEDCGIQAVTANGWPISRMNAEGFGVVARQHRIEYEQAAALDDELEVITWFTEPHESTTVRHTAIIRVADGALVSRARTLHVWIDLASGKAAAPPAIFLVDLLPSAVGRPPATGSR